MHPYRYLITVGAALFVFTCGIGAVIGGRQAHDAKHDRDHDNAAAVLFAEDWNSLDAANRAVACKIWESDVTGHRFRWAQRGATPAAVETLTELFAEQCSLEV